MGGAGRARGRHVRPQPLLAGLWLTHGARVRGAGTDARVVPRHSSKGTSPRESHCRPGTRGLGVPAVPSARSEPREEGQVHTGPWLLASRENILWTCRAPHFYTERVRTLLPANGKVRDTDSRRVAWPDLTLLGTGRKGPDAFPTGWLQEAACSLLRTPVNRGATVSVALCPAPGLRPAPGLGCVLAASMVVSPGAGWLPAAEGTRGLAPAWGPGRPARTAECRGRVRLGRCLSSSSPRVSLLPPGARSARSSSQHSVPTDRPGWPWGVIYSQAALLLRISIPKGAALASSPSLERSRGWPASARAPQVWSTAGPVAAPQGQRGEVGSQGSLPTWLELSDRDTDEAGCLVHSGLTHTLKWTLRVAVFRTVQAGPGACSTPVLAPTLTSPCRVERPGGALLLSVPGLQHARQTPLSGRAFGCAVRTVPLHGGSARSQPGARCGLQTHLPVPAAHAHQMRWTARALRA